MIEIRSINLSKETSTADSMSTALPMRRTDKADSLKRVCYDIISNDESTLVTVCANEKPDEKLYFSSRRSCPHVAYYTYIHIS